MKSLVEGAKQVVSAVNELNTVPAPGSAVHEVPRTVLERPVRVRSRERSTASGSETGQGALIAWAAKATILSLASLNSFQVLRRGGRRLNSEGVSPSG